jgi:hypothetical protein
MTKAGLKETSRMRPKVSRSGRAKALAILDRVVASSKNQKAFMADLEARFDENPVLFFRKVVMPLLSREVRVAAKHDGVMEWKSMPVEGPADNTRKEQPQ